MNIAFVNAETPVNPYPGLFDQILQLAENMVVTKPSIASYAVWTDMIGNVVSSGKRSPLVYHSSQEEQCTVNGEI